MGTSRSGAELAHKLGKLAAQAHDMPKVLLLESTAIVKGSVEAVMPKRLRGVGKKGSPIRVYAEVTGGAGTDAKGRVATRGQTQLIEHDTRKHVIPRARGPRSRQRVVVIPGVGVRARANHPGTKGKHLFAKGVAAATPAVKRVASSTVALGIRRIF